MILQYISCKSADSFMILRFTTCLSADSFMILLYTTLTSADSFTILRYSTSTHQLTHYAVHYISISWLCTSAESFMILRYTTCLSADCVHQLTYQMIVHISWIIHDSAVCSTYTSADSRFSGDSGTNRMKSVVLLFTFVDFWTADSAD